MTKTSLHCVYAGSMNRTLQMTYVPTGSHATVAGYQSRTLRDLVRGNAVVKQKKSMHVQRLAKRLLEDPVKIEGRISRRILASA
jgi:hypothetical protein